MRLTIFIPAFQEQATIAEVIRQVQAIDLTPLNMEKEIIVIDDGSTDGTSQEVERVAAGDPQLRLIRHPVNRGKGAAIRTGIAVATGDICLVQDADLEYSITDYLEILKPIASGAEAVYGSRFLLQAWPTGMRLQNLIANKLLTATANLLYGHRISDEATCLKVFRTDILRSLELTCQGFEFCPEVTAKLGLRGHKISEVPVQYTARSVESGKKIRWTDGVKAMATLVSIRVGTLRRSR